MRAAFGLLTALPLEWDPDEVAGGWAWTPAVGAVLGVAWLVFHRTFVAVGGPFVAAAGVLLLHQALTGARPVRGLASVVGRIVADPEQRRGRGLPSADGAGAAAVTLVLLAMSGFITLLDVAPASLVLVPLVGRVVQVLLLGRADTAVGLPVPSPAQRALVLAGAVVAMGIPAALAPLIRPERLSVEPVGYLLTGATAVAATALVALVARAWLRARLGPLDADGWYAVGAVADLAALAAVVVRIG